MKESAAEIKADERVALLYPTRNDFREEAVAALLRVRGNCVVVICDDSTLPEWRARIDQWVEGQNQSEVGGHPVRVIRREGGAGWKAGNLNHALRTLAGEFPYFVVCDADGIAPPDVAIAGVAALREDATLAFVQSRQAGNPHQPGTAGALGWAVNGHFDYLVEARAREGFTMFYGHGAVLRTAAWEEAGGFPEIVTEDLAWAAALRAQGWRGGYRGKFSEPERSGDRQRQFRVQFSALEPVRAGNPLLEGGAGFQPASLFHGRPAPRAGGTPAPPSWAPQAGSPPHDQSSNPDHDSGESEGADTMGPEGPTWWEDYPETLPQLRRRTEKWIRGTAEWLFKKGGGSFLRSPRVPWREKADVLVHAAQHWLALPMLVFLLLVGWVVPLRYEVFRWPGETFLLWPVPHGKTLVQQAMEVKMHVFWQPGFFLTMVFLMSAPYLGAVLDLGRQPARLWRYLSRAVYLHLSGLVAESAAVVAFLLTRRASFIATNDAAAEERGQGVPRLACVSNHWLVVLLEGAVGVGLLAGAWCQRNLWLFAPGWALATVPVVRWLGWDHPLARLLLPVPLLMILGVIVIVGRTVLGP